MTNFHHRPLKKFSLNGSIHDESAIGRLKIEYVRLLIVEMRLTGYVPRLDIDPDFTIDYNENKRYFEFELSMHGLYVGRKQSEWIEGIDGTKVIYTQKNRSNEYSQEQA